MAWTEATDICVGAIDVAQSSDGVGSLSGNTIDIDPDAVVPATAVETELCRALDRSRSYSGSRSELFSGEDAFADAMGDHQGVIAVAEHRAGERSEAVARATIKKAGDRWAVAVSGGSDSLAEAAAQLMG